ncbi:sigma-70 family RNA polymerase sigma factor [Streptomyces sp. NPDC001980]|uniref:RNA polymerase sigma factor n=1 Tax=Streptomyces sp. NPDC001980 TaxID=3157126 RepID=UPI003327D6A7
MEIGDHFEDPREDRRPSVPPFAGESPDPEATPGLNSAQEKATSATEAISPEACADFVKYCEECTDSFIRVAHRITGNLWDAQDAVQDVFLRFWKNWPDPEFRIRILGNRGYAYRSVAHAAIDAIRSGKSRKEREEEDARKVIVGTGEYSRVEDDDSFNRMLDVLQTLNPTWRLVIRLRYARELRSAEAAAVLRISEATVRRYEKRALKALGEACKRN